MGSAWPMAHGPYVAQAGLQVTPQTSCKSPGEDSEKVQAGRKVVTRDKKRRWGLGGGQEGNAQNSFES